MSKPTASLLRNALPLLAAAVAVAIFASGFQGAQPKFGIVDIDKVVFDSEMGKSNAGKLDNAVKARQGLLDFLDTNRVATVEQVQKLRTLGLKSDVTPAEKAELDKVKSDVVASSKNFDQLNQKTSPTDEERQLLQEFNTRRQNTTAALQEWGPAFQQDLLNLREQMVADSIQKAEGVIREVSKQQGFDVVFSSKSALYAANDITDAVIKALNAKP
jgi:Skp family chaperone for outer membrane proteins